MKTNVVPAGTLDSDIEKNSTEPMITEQDLQWTFSDELNSVQNSLADLREELEEDLHSGEN